jgi:hypothetical protein
MIMTGYEEGSKAYRLCNPSTNKVVVTCDVVFEEDLSWIWDSTELDEIFTIVYSELKQHADDQETKSPDNVKASTGYVAGDTRAAQVATRPAGACAGATGDGAVECCPRGLAASSSSRGRPGDPGRTPPRSPKSRGSAAEPHGRTARVEVDSGLAWAKSSDVGRPAPSAEETGASGMHQATLMHLKDHRC